MRETSPDPFSPTPFLLSKEQRYIHAIDQIVNFTHLSHHPDEDDKYISFTRSEAVFVLGATISVVSSYAEYKI
jgi:hypothetical protein